MKFNNFSKAFLLFVIQLVILISGYGIKSIQSKILGPEDFGILVFFLTFTSYILIFVDFGFFDSLKVILANNSSLKKEKEITGAGLVLTVLLSLIYFIIIFLASFFIDKIFNINFGYYLRIISPLCIILPFTNFLNTISIGTGKSIKGSLFDLFNKIFYFSLVLLLLKFYFTTLFNFILFYLLSIIISITIVFISFFKFSFKNLKKNCILIMLKNKKFGIHTYLGGILNQGTYKLDGLLISYFVNTVQLGFYNLASLICLPMLIFSQSLISIFFKELASLKKIPKNLILINLFFSLFSVFFLLIFSDNIVNLLFGYQYSQVSKYIFPFSIVYLFHCLYLPFSFLIAKSKGKEVRNIAIIESIINLIANFILIPLLGIMGAIYASILSKFTHFMGLLYYYKKNF